MLGTVRGAMTASAPVRTGVSTTTTLLVILLTGAAVSVALGVDADEHTPTGDSTRPALGK
jgi:hypothetical protein